MLKPPARVCRYLQCFACGYARADNLSQFLSHWYVHDPTHTLCQVRWLLRRPWQKPTFAWHRGINRQLRSASTAIEWCVVRSGCFGQTATRNTSSSRAPRPSSYEPGGPTRTSPPSLIQQEIWVFVELSIYGRGCIKRWGIAAGQIHRALERRLACLAASLLPC